MAVKQAETTSQLIIERLEFYRSLKFDSEVMNMGGPGDYLYAVENNRAYF